MLTKEKSLYQVKLILDYLPKEEYKLIPQDLIDYVEENFEYDENITIDPSIPLEKQKLDDKTYDFLEKMMKKVERNKAKYSKDELDAYVQKAKLENEKFDAKLEVIHLKEIIENYKKENDKLPKAKELIKEYQELIESKDKEIEALKEENKKYCEYIEKIPRFVKKVFLKEKLLHK